MKFNVPPDYQGDINDVDGKKYLADENNQVEIPDDKVHDGLYGLGLSIVQSIKPFAENKSTTNSNLIKET